MNIRGSISQIACQLPSDGVNKYLGLLTHYLVSASAAHHVKVNFLWTKQLHITQDMHFHVSEKSVRRTLIYFTTEFSILIQDSTCV